MRFEPRRKLPSDCSFSLFAIMTKQAGSHRVGLVDGDQHSCGPADIGVGSRRGEPDGRTGCRTWSPSLLRYPTAETLFTLGGETQTTVLVPEGSEVRAAPVWI